MPTSNLSDPNHDNHTKKIYEDWHNNLITFEDALAKLNAIQGQAIKDDDLSTQAFVQYVLGLIYAENTQYEDAIAQLVKAEKLFTQVKNFLYVGYATRLIADFITQTANTSSEQFKLNADFYYSEAIKAFEQIADEGEIANTLLAHGQSLTQRGDKRSASVKYQRAMEILTRLKQSNS